MVGQEQVWVLYAVKLAQWMPQNWLGQQIAQVMRKLVMQFADLPLRCEVDGLQFEFLLKDNNSEKKYLFMPWRFDQRERRFLVDSIPVDGTFVDIGANVGIYTLYVAKHLSDKGRVISFEPNPRAHDRLSKNVSLNEASVSADVALMQLGVAAEEASFDLYLNADNLGGSSLVAESGETVSVACKPLLTVMRDLGVEKISGLKIDIEGAEDAALAPFFEHAPREMFPDVIVIENSQELWKRDLFQLFAESGYQLQFKTRLNSVFAKRAD